VERRLGGHLVFDHREIYGHEILAVYAIRAVSPIHILVKNGNVTLEGVVANKLDKQVAYTEASMVSGVFSVINNLIAKN
jgi:hyperosmotically inducible periplasmic protein